ADTSVLERLESMGDRRIGDGESLAYFDWRGEVVQPDDDEIQDSAFSRASSIRPERISSRMVSSSAMALSAFCRRLRSVIFDFAMLRASASKSRSPRYSGPYRSSSSSRIRADSAGLAPPVVTVKTRSPRRMIDGTAKSPDSAALASQQSTPRSFGADATPAVPIGSSVSA